MPVGSEERKGCKSNPGGDFHIHALAKVYTLKTGAFSNLEIIEGN